MVSVKWICVVFAINCCILVKNVDSSRFPAVKDICNPTGNDCFHDATCQNGVCICPGGWEGVYCENCQGRFLENKANGTIEDGQYNENHESDCLWLIQPDPSAHQANSTLYLLFNHVNIVCEGDFLHVYDGDGVFSPLLATFNGAVPPSSPISEVVAGSGKALLHFQRRGGITEMGYSVSYWYQTDPSSSANEKYNQSLGNWESHTWSSMIAQGRASAAMAMNNDDIYIFGGFLFGEESSHEQMLRIDPKTFTIEPVSSPSSPSPRFGHSMVSHKNQLIVFGGMLVDSFIITNELWSFNITTMEWTQILPQVDETSGLAMDEGSTLPPPVDVTTDTPTLFGHTSHLLNLNDGRNVMLVIFGFHPQWQYSNFVFEYDIVKNTWCRVKCNGAVPHGSYGHASAHDEVNNLVYVHGGMKGQSSYEDEMFVYDAERKFWSALHSIPSPRYLHTMVLLHNSLLVYGGRSLVETEEEICNDIAFEKYDIASDTWKELPRRIPSSKSRFGHSAVGLDNRTMFVYGGYDGTMHSDVLIYTLEYNTTLCSDLYKEACSLSPFCAWMNNTCSPLQCMTEIDFHSCSSFCASKVSCIDCLSTGLQCCNCSYSPSSFEPCFYGNDNSSFTNISLCDAEESMEEFCDSFLNCAQCNVADGCAWTNTHCEPGNTTSFECPPSCSEQTNCSTCLSVEGCRWCESTSTCVTQSVTDVYYPYGTCTNWRSDDCKDPCMDYTSCDGCSEDVRCGWCATDVNTGTGTCMSGSSHAPVNNMTCMSEDWFFIECPDCQCNGHSTCEVGTDVCSDCSQHTTGETCDTCDIGYYGRPLNGANCSECLCNGHADDCDDDGSCYCRASGMIDSGHCNSCSSAYTGDPAAPNGTCFYEIDTQIRYYFTLASKSYENITQMNLDVCPAFDWTYYLQIYSTGILDATDAQHFDVRITYNYTGTEEDSVPETLFASYKNSTSIQLLLKDSRFHFGGHPRCCLRIYLTFRTPFIFNGPCHCLLRRNNAVENS